MNKKLQKGIVAAVAASLGTGIVAPVYAASAETTDLASKYAKAYEATVAAKTQKELTEARKLVDALYVEVKGTANEYLATTLSSLLDPLQQKELVKLDNAIKAAEASATQANVNAARALIVDMPEVWRNAFSSYIDTIQNEIIANAVDAAKKAQESGVQVDLDAANALYTELLTVTNNDGVKSWVETALKAELDKVVVAAKIVSFEAVGAKKLEVKFNQAVDSTKATFTVKRGTIASNVASVTFADDKQSAVIELSSKLVKADYSVSVAGLTTTALTATKAVEDEKIAKIEILSDVAVIDNTNADQAKVGYKVSNQYGENITSASTSLTLTTTAADQATTDLLEASGKVLLDNNGVDYKEGDKVTVSILDSATGTFTSKAVTVSAKAKTSSVAITGLYQVDSKVLSADTVTTDVPTFKLLVDAKDQYGNSVVPSALATGDVVVTTSDASIIQVGAFTTATIDGATKTVLPLAMPTGSLKAGTATITVMSKTTGSMAKYNVVVAEGAKVDALTIELPELVVAGETAKATFTATDTNGNEVTKASILGDTSVGGKGVRFSGQPAGMTFTFNQNYITNKAELSVGVTSAVVAGKYPIIVQTATGKTQTLTVDVKAVAVPTVIVGLDSTVTRNIVKGETLSISEDKVIVNDQYGRVIGLDAKLGAANSTASNYQLVIEKEDSANDKVTLTTASAVADNDSLAVRGDLKGSAALKVRLNKDDSDTGTVAVPVVETVANSEFSFIVNVVEKADFVSYEIGEIGAIYNDGQAADADYGRDLVVYGVLANGTKAVVPTSWYTVSTSNVKLDYNNGQLEAINDLITDGEDRNVNVEVIVDAKDAPVILTKTVTVTEAAPAVASTEVDDSVVDGAVTFSATTTAGTIAAADLQGLFTFEDQYGETRANNLATVTITNVADANTTAPALTLGVASNGQTTTSVTNVESGDSFYATIRLDGYTKTIKVIVTP